MNLNAEKTKPKMLAANLKNCKGELFLTMLALLFLCGESSGMFEDKEAGARPLGMGGAFSAVSDDLNSLWWNPAGLARLERKAFTSMDSKLFGLEELKYNSLGYGQALGNHGTLGVGWQGFGGDLYKEDILTISYASSYFSRVPLGLNLRNLKLKIEGAGEAETWGVDLGALWNWGEKTRVGFFARNINSPEIAGEQIEKRLSLGLAFWPFENLILAVDLNEEEGHSSWFSFGQELRVTPHFFLRAGIQTDPSRLAGGFGARWGFSQIDYAYFSHSVLGATHQFSLTLREKR